MESPPSPPAIVRRQLELGLGALLFGAALGLRLWVTIAVPTLPVSDFRGVVDFALAFRDQGVAAGGYYWDVLNVGPALSLALLFHLLPGEPETIARLATAVFTGLMALLPYVLWRGALPLWVRALASAMLAFWPGQVLFSGVVAQDNWVTPPSVALGCLAVRCLVLHKPQPLAAGLLYALTVAMRQEMLYALLPLFLAACGILQSQTRRWRPVVLGIVAAAVPLLAMALQRQAATGQFALSSGHVGYTLLGTVAPGATRIGWSDPASFAASVRPDVAGDRHRLMAAALPIALDEMRRRPGFFALRSVAFGIRGPFTSDADDLYWSFLADGVLAPSDRPAGEALAADAAVLLASQSMVVQGLFLGAVGLGLWRRNPAILVLAAAVLFKIGLHAVLVWSPRFYVPATALQLLAIAVGAEEASRAASWRVPIVAALCGLLGAGALARGGHGLLVWVRSHDVDEQRLYRFALQSDVPGGSASCTVQTGKVSMLASDEATIEPLSGGGTRAVADCTVTSGGAPGTLALELFSRVSDGSPGTLIQRVDTPGRRPLLLRKVDAGEPARAVAVPLVVQEPAAIQRIRVETEVQRGGSAPAVTTRLRLRHVDPPSEMGP